MWFADFGLPVVRPRCFEEIEDGLLPQKWMGQRIAPIKSWGGGDVDEQGADGPHLRGIGSAGGCLSAALRRPDE